MITARRLSVILLASLLAAGCAGLMESDEIRVHGTELPADSAVVVTRSVVVE